MAKGKYKEWLEPDGILRLQAWARDGLNDEQIAHNMGIATSTLYEWKNAYKEIAEALKRGKEVTDIEVENAVNKSAKGFFVKTKRVVMKKVVTYKDGKRLKEETEPVLVEETNYIKPDTTAQIFWLKHRKEPQWGDF